MNIALNKEDFSINNVYFSDPIKNSIIENSNFIRLIYSNSLMALNGIYIKIDFENIYKINDFSKQKIIFNSSDNQKIINYIKSIEFDVLEKFNIKTKKKVYKLNEQMMTGYIKHSIDAKYTSSFMLKISGIWESEQECGLTFKFVEINHQ
ncbi:MAG: hypothetical protein WD512_20110 [Candidatus Paceibacterota bacterium]